ncbi:hypothetical protein [Viridibacillus sp. FSL R5-0468]|uniref:hypothetical protein n=1 Tax=Viridibacillus sp. FSL R5-0468 TaxID=2921640 RepID=UPI004047A525
MDQYITSPIVDESKEPSCTHVYGFEPSPSPKEAYNGFIEIIQDFLNMNMNKNGIKWAFQERC